MDIDKDGILDNTPLKFGKYKGKTPTQLLDSEGKTELSWLRWAYETVTNFPVCSEALYKAAGGRLSRAKGATTQAPAADPMADRYESRGHTRAKSKWDDFDDGIPF
jgi:hypothetical protein